MGSHVRLDAITGLCVGLIVVLVLVMRFVNMLRIHDCGMIVVRAMPAAVFCQSKIEGIINDTISKYLEVDVQPSHLYSELSTHMHQESIPA